MKYKALDAVEEQNAVEMEEAKAMDAVEVNNVSRVKSPKRPVPPALTVHR